VRELLSWVWLLAAIGCEVVGTTSMKVASGFTKLVPSIAVFVFYGLSLAAMTVALRRIEISVAYAVWSAIGTAAIATIGYLWFREPMTPLKLISLGLIVLGVVGLNLAGATRG
jgi:small multidrug resistance pump